VRGIFILRNIHVAGLSFEGWQTVDPRQLFEAADRLSCDNTFIGASRCDFNSNQTFFRGRQRDGSNSATGLTLEGRDTKKLPMGKSLQQLLRAEIRSCQHQHYAGMESLCRQLTSDPLPTSRAGNLMPWSGVALEPNIIHHSGNLFFATA